MFTFFLKIHNCNEFNILLMLKLYVFIPVAVPAPYATFPPGMRPGFVPPFVQTPAVYNAVNPYPVSCHTMASY